MGWIKDWETALLSFSNTVLFIRPMSSTELIFFVMISSILRARTKNEEEGRNEKRREKRKRRNEV
jgi:hypothetical protein